MTTREKLEEAKRLLSEVNAEWDESKIIAFGSSMSFDELVAEVRSISLS